MNIKFSDQIIYFYRQIKTNEENQWIYFGYFIFLYENFFEITSISLNKKKDFLFIGTNQNEIYQIDLSKLIV